MTLATLAPASADGELRSVSIAMTVLDCFAGAGEVGPSEVARRTGIAKSTASRMLSALAGGGLLERTPAGRYRLGLRMVHFGQLAVDRLPVRSLARPVLVELQQAVRETVQLGLPVGGYVLHVERMGSGPVGSRLAGEVLRRVPAYASSAGRVMAAFDAGLAGALLAGERRLHTRFTVVDDERLERILAAGRAAGWVASKDELEPGVSSVAAPILLPPAPGASRVVGAVSVVGPTGQLLGPRREFVTAGVCRAARRISALVTAAQEGR